MADNDAPNGGTSTPDPNASTDAAGTGSGTPDQASLWQSRFNGQTAKVGELTTALKAHQERVSELEKALKAAQETSASADDAAKALVAQARAELEAERAARRLDTLKARFPETAALFGDAITGLTEANLAASEARLTGAAGGGSTEPPTPLRHGEARTGQAGAGTKSKPESAADIRARLESMPLPPDWQ